MKIDEIRTQFLDFYDELGFQLLPRASMLHPSIPMSFVMSAGLIQIETSLSKMQNRSGNKFMLIQDCFRHFDLDNVGNDDFHLSLFEMPGAFVFSTDGKQQVIWNMWRLATEKLGINKNHIWASYFKGDLLNGKELPEDDVTYNTWLNIGIPEKRIVGLGIKHNYWLQSSSINGNGSDFRKCGPNTELFYDLGKELACGVMCKPSCKCGRFIEFSNSLFVNNQLNPQENTITRMTDPFIETVIGNERIAMILQGANSIFETEDYRPIISTIQKFSDYHSLPFPLITSSERVIADYMRALTVLIADGAPPPGKNGRARLIRLLIRGVITRQQILEITSKDFLRTLIRMVVEIFGNSLIDQHLLESKILNYFEIEFSCFNNNIKRSKCEMEKIFLKNRGKTLSCKQILLLTKKWGLPVPLLTTMLFEKGLRFAETEYKEELVRWRNKTYN